MRTAPIALFTILIACSICSPSRAADDPATPGFSGKADDASLKKIVFVSGPPSHGFGAHEHFAGLMLLAKALNENVPGVEAVVYKWKWPEDPHAFDNAAAIIIYSDGGGGHIAIPHLKQLSELMDKGVGLGCIHYAVEVPKGEPGEDFLKWIGGYFEVRWSVNPTWEARFGTLPQKHAVSNGVGPFITDDEWYYHMRFRDNMEGVTPILSAVPPDQTRQGRDDDHGGNPAVRSGIGKHILETTLWVSERPGDGRGFGCTGGHVHWNWASDPFRKTVLNAIVWIAHIEVPKDGVTSKTPSVDDLLANQDEPVPANFKPEEIEKRIQKMNGKESTEAK